MKRKHQQERLLWGGHSWRQPAFEQAFDVRQEASSKKYGNSAHPKHECRRDTCGSSVGQAGSLRPIANRPLHYLGSRAIFVDIYLLFVLVLIVETARLGWVEVGTPENAGVREFWQRWRCPTGIAWSGWVGLIWGLDLLHSRRQIRLSSTSLEERASAD